MTIQDLHDTYAWQEAMELARPLTRLSEELPAHETHGLTRTIQTAMVDLPTTIGLDLLKNTQTRQTVLLRLDAALELIERIYPALDASEAREMLERLTERSESGRLGDVIPAPQPLGLPDEEGDFHDDV